LSRNIVIESCSDFILEQDTDHYYLEVTCGTTAVFTITFKLSLEETRGYLEQGETYLRHLSYSVRDHPDDFIIRKV